MGGYHWKTRSQRTKKSVDGVYKSQLLGQRAGQRRVEIELGRQIGNIWHTSNTSFQHQSNSFNRPEQKTRLHKDAPSIQNFSVSPWCWKPMRSRLVLKTNEKQADVSTESSGWRLRWPYLFIPFASWQTKTSIVRFKIWFGLQRL